MVSIRISCEPPDRERLIAELWEAGSTGITEESDSALLAFFEAEADVNAIVSEFAAYDPSVHHEDDRDWVRFAQDQWQPFPVGDRFYLVPEWRDDPVPEGRVRLRMHPGMACGTGTHAATRLCLLAMERYIGTNDSVIDVGTGAGILADAALLLGAHPVVGCDIEHDATVVARSNLDLSISLFTGSARSVRSGAFQWAVCNLNAATLSNLATELNRISRRLILSGFREEEAPAVASKYGREVQERFDLEGYACVVLR